MSSADRAVVAAGKLRVEVTSLEMKQAPSGQLPEPPAADLRIDRVSAPSVPLYRFLYNTVGEPWLWGDRRKLSDAEIREIMQDPLVELHVLYVGGEPAGYAELDRRIEGEIELAYFGIRPEFTGQKLGTYLLMFAIRRAWTYRPNRLWVHTCTLDHPAALPLYRRCGFEPFKTVEEIQDDPRVLGLIPKDAAPQHPIIT
ncbi:MAG: GNAT family N-acetyltransferase [Methyloligellaceae bacterium]